MIIGLMGPSCSGKSFFFSLLQKKGFIVPQSVTTRTQRKCEAWHLRSISKKDFVKLKESNCLSFVTQAFNNYYACVNFPDHSKNNIVMIITRENVVELRSKGGIIIYIKPWDIQYCIDLIRSQGRTDSDDRITELLFSSKKFEELKPDVTFCNKYNRKSAKQFIELIKKIVI